MAENSDGSLFAAQWRNPAGFLSLLMIIGGPIIQSALAQLTGPVIVPICFSFGWVSYAFSSITALVGDGRLMPPADYACKVINLKNGYTRTNKSWIIGRLLRDLEIPLSDEAMYLSVYDGGRRQDGNIVSGGKSRWFGLLAILMQLGIAAIPFGLYYDWGIFLIVVIGTFITFMTAALPQWRVEKLACRTNSDKAIAITTGNGARHVLVIIGNGNCIDLEDLATGEGPRQRRPWINYGWFATKQASETEVRLWRDLPVDFWMTRFFCTIFILLWAAILISVLSLKENAWFLVGSGTIGMIQNAVVAAASRAPDTRGIHLTNKRTFIGFKVMDVLMDFDDVCEGYGRVLLKEFFSAGLDFPKDRGEGDWWDERARRAEAEKNDRIEKGKVKETDSVKGKEIVKEKKDNGESSKVGKSKDRYDIDRYQEMYKGKRYDEPSQPRGTIPTRGTRYGAKAITITPTARPVIPSATASAHVNNFDEV